MTFASASIGRSLTRTGRLLRTQIWIWPIVAVVVLSIVGFGMKSAIESTMQRNITSALQTLLNVEVGMLQNWFEVQESNAELCANDKEVRQAVFQLLERSEANAAAPPADQAAVQKQLRAAIGPIMSSHGYTSFFVVDRKKRIIATDSDELLGQQDVPEYESFLTMALAGETTVSPPFPSVGTMKDQFGRMRTGVPVMAVCAPIRDESFQVVGALALRLQPEQKFTKILQLGQIGKTGETYAFDKSGLMVSNSRFDHDLILSGLLPDHDYAHSILSIQVRDPGGDMTAGYRPAVRRAEQPLTRMALAASAGEPGIDVDGYRDYRGVLVVGVWTWLPKYGLGVATEVDAAEAYRPLTILQRTFFGMFALLGATSAAIFVFTVVVARLRRDAQRSAVEAKQLGQYKLEDKLGSGGMGVVYKGRHAMLRRPTAIKLLDIDKVDETSIGRFEREVQITCQLNHPNTIAIYDYGRTAEGVFYYAMEFLDGIDLQQLVERYGPQPEGRVIRILLQICGSLFEAHSQGMVHRDIKPANLMLNRRGGEPDVVKVLDFGLVKALDDEKSGQGSEGLTGTPLYMSPEAIQTPMSVDHRSDLYAVGAVGYFLLTGKPVFEARSVVELCQKHVDAVPEPPSQRLGRPISAEVESALLACLDKSRAKRPQTARDLAQLLARSPAAGTWTVEQADVWWGRHERGTSPSADTGQQPATAARIHEQTMAHGSD
ncbi:MAG: serine/threonine protein kinase [Pirellulales bacterium]